MFGYGRSVWKESGGKGAFKRLERDSIIRKKVKGENQKDKCQTSSLVCFSLPLWLRLFSVYRNRH
jgi:hypothetical protein